MATAVVNGEVASRHWRLKLPERLPHLTGRWLVLYSVAWAILAAIAVVGALAGTAYRLDRGAGQTFTYARIGIDFDDETAIVRGVAGPGQNVISPGDLILSVNGHKLRGKGANGVEEATAADDSLRVPEGTVAHLTIRDRRGTKHEIALTSRAPNATSLYSDTGLTPTVVTALCAISFLLAPMVLIASAFLLYRRRGDPVAALLSLSFIILSCVSGSGNVAWVRWIGDKAFQSIVPLFGVGGFLGLALALLVFPRGEFKPRWTAGLAMILPFFLLALLFPTSNILNYGFLAVLFAALASMAVRYRRTVADERQQWRWAMLGFVTGISLFTAWGVGYEAYLKAHRGLAVDLWSWVLSPTMAALCMTLMVSGVTLSILRYRLYDSAAALSRSAAYGILTLGFVALFAGAEKLAEIVGERYFEHSIGIVAGAVGAAVAAAIVVPLHNRVHRWAERRFQKPLIRLREGLPECVSDLRDSAPVEQLVSAVMKQVEAGVRSTCEAVLLTYGGKLALAGARGVSDAAVENWQAGWHPTAEQTLESDRRDTRFPLRVRLCIETFDEPETIGWLVLGPRPDGSFFGKDEREALEHVAGPIARAIHVAQLRDRHAAQAERRLNALETLVERIAATLDGPKSARI
jgi:hypothetical protein